MTYDESMARVEAIVKQLEEAEAISLSEYKALAEEAATLLKQCREQIAALAEEIQK